MSKFNDEPMDLPAPPSKSAFTRKAASARELPEPEPAPPPKEKKARKKKAVKLEQVSLKLHPDLIAAIGKLAAIERKMPAEVMRDLILKGLRAEGIEL